MKTTINDFTFYFSGHGHYTVRYSSPVTTSVWKYTTSNMQLIDATKNADSPLRKDLDQLKKLVKTNGTKIN